VRYENMKTILISILLLPSLSLADDLKLLCKGEEIKYLEDDPNSKEVITKVIGIQLYEVGMRLDGVWFDNKSDFTEDYILERSYVKSNDNIRGARNFSTNSFIEGRKIQTVKVDNVEINILTNEVHWMHKFNRLEITDSETDLIYAFRKNFEGNCK
jgi:hypothetical protein